MNDPHSSETTPQTQFANPGLRQTISDTAHGEPATEPTPFEKFDAFTRRIMAVPKSEIDAKEAEQKAKRANRQSAKTK